MHKIRLSQTVGSFLLAVTGAAGCTDSTAPPPSPQFGAIDVTITTTSPAAFIDPDGYVVTLDDLSSRSVGVNDAISLGSVPVGRHFVRLIGLAANCSVDGALLRVVDIPTNEAARQQSVVFELICTDPDSLYPWDY